MDKQLSLKLASAAVAGAFMLAPLAVQGAGEAVNKAAADKITAPMIGVNPATNAAANPGPMTEQLNNRIAYSDRENYKLWSNEKEVLKSMLKPGEGKDFYRKALSDNGFTITSINADRPERVEYEVVKGAHSYEVQIDLDKAGAKASKVEIDSNLWRADSTKAAMRGQKTEPATAFVATNERYSDRARMKGWTSEKEKLEKALKTGQDKAAYAEQLKKLGYQITSTNEREKDYVEYEIVKGDNSYEVQIDLQNGKAKEIDVTANMWHSEATERAMSSGNSR